MLFGLLFIIHYIHFRTKKSQSPKTKKPKATKVPKSKAKDRKKKEIILEAEIVEETPLPPPSKPKR